MSKKNLFFCLLGILTTIYNCQPALLEIPDNKTLIVGPQGQLLDSVLSPYVEELRRLTDNNAGLAIGVTNSDQIIYARTFGYEDIETGVEADFNTLFHIASLSKPFTAAAIAKLVQTDKLNLDDKIIDHIPEFRMLGEGYKQITIEHILSHTSGIPRHVSPNDWLNPKPLEANLDFATEFELDFEPGTQFNYSNSAFDILGIVISRASEIPFPDYVTKHILVPSGMTNSAYQKPIGLLPTNWAKPYSYGLETQEWTPYPLAENFTPSSGLQSTLIDMCTWGLLHLNQGTYAENQLLDLEHFNMLVNPYYDTPWEIKLA